MAAPSPEGAHIASVRVKAFKSVGDAWLEVAFARGLNAIVGEARGARAGWLAPLRRTGGPQGRSAACSAGPPREGRCLLLAGSNGCGKSSLLDAIQFAFAAPARALGVPQLSDLRNSTSQEPAEVQVQLRSPGGGSHRVSAALAPDGSRVFRVEGRIRSGKEVREFLRALGVCLDGSSAVIRQAQVTSLADDNSPASLAAVVAEASGLGERQLGAPAGKIARRSCEPTAAAHCRHRPPPPPLTPVCPTHRALE